MFPITVARYEKSLTPPQLLERDVGRRLPSQYLDPIKIYINNDEDIGKISPNDSRNGSPKEDYFYSLYQNAKKTIQSSPAVSTSKEHSTYISSPSNIVNMEVEVIHSPSYPVTPPSTSCLSPVFRKTSSSNLHLPTSPTITEVSSKSHLYNQHPHHTPPPPPPPHLPSYFSSRRECSTGSCKWLFPLDRCHSCRSDDFPYHIPNHIPLHQRAFFSNEFLLRQKEKWRRPRTVYTEKQLAALEKAYKKNKYLRGQERKELCKTLSLEERHIKVWYQNRRAKERGQIRHDKWLQRSRRPQQQQEGNKNKNNTKKSNNSEHLQTKELTKV